MPCNQSKKQKFPKIEDELCLFNFINCFESINQIWNMPVNKLVRYDVYGLCTNHLFGIQHPITNTGRFPQW